MDRAKAELAMALVGSGSMSAVIDLALERLVRAERRKADAVAYRARPQGAPEVQIACLGDARSLVDDTDWEALYADSDP